MALVRKATLTDLPDIVRLERRCPTAAHWTEQQYREALADLLRGVALIAQTEDTGATSGFLIVRHLPPEWEIENIVVAEELRKTGIATELLRTFLAQAKVMNGDSVFLEVRESNTAARGVYEKLGFQQTGRRKSYYLNPLEDAVLYCKDLGGGRNSG